MKFCNSCLTTLLLLSVIASNSIVYAANFNKVVTLQTTPEPLQIDLSNTALIVADMQNAYLSRGGIWDRLGQDLSGSVGAVKNTRNIIHAARLAGLKVIYLKMRFSQEQMDDSGNESPSKQKGIALATMSNRPRFKGQMMRQNPWNEEIVEELKPQPGDLIVEKYKYSGFSQTSLDKMLKNLKIRNVIITGVATNICVESTLRDAYALDYWPILVADGTSNVGPQFTQQATIWNVQAFFGWIISTADLVNELLREKR